MMIPNIAVAAAAPAGFWHTAVCIFLPLGFYTLWGALLPASGIMILLAVPLMFLAAFQLVLLYLFDEAVISCDMFANMMTTTLSESSELMRNIYPALIGIVSLYVALLAAAVYSLIRRRRMSDSVRRGALLSGAVLIFIGTAASVIVRAGTEEEFLLTEKVFPGNVIYNHWQNCRHWVRVRGYGDISSGFDFRAERQTDVPEREIYVMVVGESSRAFSWGAYGYGRNTTPRLDTTSNVCWFTSVLTQSNATYKSVPMMMSCINAGTYDFIYGVRSIASLFSDAGFRTAVISNQSPDGAMIDNFVAAADATVHLGDDGAAHLDGEILPVLERIISGSDDDLFVIVHMYGSHFNYKNRYPSSFAQFRPDDFSRLDWDDAERVVNAYDNSVLYTDDVLCSIISMLDRSGACSAMLFCSDHGEDLFDDSASGFLHSSSTLSYYQLHVPCFCWMSDRYVSAFPDKMASAKANRSSLSSTSSVFHTVSDMAGISSPYVSGRHSLLSDGYDASLVKYYLDDNNKAVRFRDTGLKESDLSIFRNRNIDLSM